MYVTREAREELVEVVGDAIDEMGAALGALGDAYEQLDERTADALEAGLFRPAQAAYGRAKRTYAGFAERHGLEGGRAFETVSPGAASRGVRAFVEMATESVEEADNILADLQDSMRPVEVLRRREVDDPEHDALPRDLPQVLDRARLHRAYRGLRLPPPDRDQLGVAHVGRLLDFEPHDELHIVLLGRGSSGATLLA